MFATIINDCSAENDFGRQATRLSSLLNTNVNTVGVVSTLGSDSTIMASGNLVDMIDAAEGRRGVIIANVAPRGAIKDKWHNGSPFGYFYNGDTLVLSSIEGYILSLVKKLKLATTINLLHLEPTLYIAKNTGLIDENLSKYIETTQFRSYEYLPRVAAWMLNGENFESEALDIENISDIPNTIWYIDNFGNYKTTILESELKINNNKIATKIGELNLYKRLKDLPSGETGIFTGSSGYNDKRFVEIAIQKGNAHKKYNLKIGDSILE